MRLSVLLGLIALGFVYFFALRILPPEIETALQARASATLQAESHDWARFEVDGRDLRLSGRAPSAAARDQARTSLQRIPGVRKVDDQAELAAAPAIAAPANEPVAEIGLTVAEPVVAAADTELPPPELSIPSVVAGQADNEPAVEEVPAALSKIDSNTCNEQLAAVQAEEKIQFRVNTSYVLPRSDKMLEQLSLIAKSCGEVQLTIGGHTDSQGSAAVNRKLSQLRAETVRDFLISKGVEGKRLEAIGYGAAKPIADNKTAAGRAQNRRIEISVGG